MANIKQIKIGTTTYDIVDAGAARSSHTHSNYLTSHQDLSNYVTLNTDQTITGKKTFGPMKMSGRWQNAGDDEGLIIEKANNGYAGVCLGDPGGVRSVFYLNSDNKAVWRYCSAAGETSYDVSHPGKAGTIALTTDLSRSYSGTTGGNSGTAIAAVTGVTGNGTATALTGVKVSSSSSAAPGGHTHSYDKTTGVSLTANDSTATGRIAYVSSISSTGASASGTAKAGSEGHTHTYDKASLSGSNTSHTTKYMKFSAGTTPVSSASPDLTDANTGANSGSAVSVVTGVSGGSGSLTSNDTSSGGIAYISSASHTAASLGTPSTEKVCSSAHYHNTAGTATIVRGTAPSLGSATTKYLSASLGTTSATATGTATKSSSSTVSVVTATWGEDGNLYLTSANVASSSHTHPASVSYTKATGVTLTANSSSATGRIQYVQSQGSWSAGTAPVSYITINIDSSEAISDGSIDAVTGYPNFSGGSASHTTKYLHHSHTGASASGTANVAPNNHTHSYSKTTGISITRGTAPSMNFNTQSSSDTPYVASMTNSSIGISHTSTNTGTPSATTTFVTGVGGGTTSATTKYLSASPSHTATNTGANSGTNFNAATAVGSNGTATVLTGVKATGTASVAPSGHTHSYSGSTN